MNANQKFTEKQMKTAKDLFVQSERQSSYDGMRFMANTYALLFPQDKETIEEMNTSIKEFLPW